MSLNDKIRNKFSRMPSKKRKRVIYGALIFIFIISMYFAYGVKESGIDREAQKAEEKRKAFVLPNPDRAKDAWVEKGQRELMMMKRDVGEMKDFLKDMQAKLNSGEYQTGTPGSSATPTPGSAAEREAILLNDLKNMGVNVEKGGEVYPPSPIAPAVPAETKQGLTPGAQQASEQQTSSQIPTTPPTTPPPGPNTTSGQGGITVAPPQQQVQSVMGVYTFSKADDQVPVEEVSAEEEVNFENFYTPTGSFFKVSLLSGVDAPAGPTASTQAHPVLLRIQDLTWLPNEVRQNVSGCFVLCEAFGDLATERAYIRGINISCVNKENKYVLDEPLQGYLADSDGKIGMRGRVVSKRGEFLYRAMLATLIQAVGQGFENAGTTTVVTDSGNVKASDMDNFSDGFRSGVGSGLNKTAEKLGDFYLKNAEKLYPIVEIGATRNATFVLTLGKRFLFDKKIIEGNSKKEKVDGEL